MALPIALSACGDDAPVTQQNFAPLDYGYLSKLRLNVGTIDVQNHSALLGDSDAAGDAPTPPAAALDRMAHDRLFAAGTSGTAVFVIDQASIVREHNGTLDGQLAVHLDIIGEGGTRVGYAEARVARQHVPGSDAEDPKAALYAMTRQMMDDMNVEFEFQLRRSLKDWLVTAGAVAAPVIAQPLQGSPLPPESPASGVAPSFGAPGLPVPTSGALQPGMVPPPLPPATVPPAADDAPAMDPPTTGSAMPPPTMLSPPPGYLQVPPGTGY